MTVDQVQAAWGECITGIDKRFLRRDAVEHDHDGGAIKVHATLGGDTFDVEGRFSLADALKLLEAWAQAKNGSNPALDAATKQLEAQSDQLAAAVAKHVSEKFGKAPMSAR